MMAERRLLVVDDDARVRFVLSRALHGLGDHYKILTAGTASEALDLLAQHTVDLVITDINLPDISGVDLTEEILAEMPHTAVIWITAYGCHRMAQERNYAEIGACLEKPIGIGEIRAEALKALRERDRDLCNTLASLQMEAAGR